MDIFVPESDIITDESSYLPVITVHFSLTRVKSTSSKIMFILIDCAGASQALFPLLSILRLGLNYVFVKKHCKVGVFQII